MTRQQNDLCSIQYQPGTYKCVFSLSDNNITVQTTFKMPSKHLPSKRRKIRQQNSKEKKMEQWVNLLQFQDVLQNCKYLKKMVCDSDGKMKTHAYLYSSRIFHRKDRENTEINPLTHWEIKNIATNIQKIRTF